MSAGVLGLLATTPSIENRMAFHFSVALFANGIEQRGQTTHYTVFSEDSERFMDAAKRHGVTVEKIVGAGVTAKVTVGDDGSADVQAEDGPGETYEVLYLAKHGQRWRAPRRTET